MGPRLDLVLLLAARSVLRNARRSLISLGAVSFGVAALVVAGGFVESLLLKLREDTIYSHLGHIQIQDPRFAELGVSRPYAYLLPTEPVGAESPARLAGVKLVTPRLALNGLVSVGDTTLSFTGHAIDTAKEEWLGRGLTITAGRALRGNDRNSVIMGEGLAANLGVRPGDEIVLLVNTAGGTINAVEVVVRGLFATISKLYDDTGLRLPLATAQALLRVKGAQQWLVLLDDTDSTVETVERIRSILPEARFKITRWDEDADFYHKTAQLFARQFGFIRFVVAAIIVLSILNTMTMNVLERTWEIGVMLALGDSRRHVLATFACEGALLGLLGSILGAMLGLAAAIALSNIGISMPPPPGMNRGFDVGIEVSTWLLVTATGLGFIAALVASLPPAVRASRLPVVDALRIVR